MNLTSHTLYQLRCDVASFIKFFQEKLRIYPERNCKVSQNNRVVKSVVLKQKNLEDKVICCNEDQEIN